MRKILAKSGDIRKRKKFLWFPKIIDGELRWLEVAKWAEIYEFTGVNQYNESVYLWIAKNWEN